jgi:hypothetical protein
METEELSMKLVIKTQELENIHPSIKMQKIIHLQSPTPDLIVTITLWGCVLLMKIDPNP